MKSWKNIAVLTLSSALIVGSFLISDSSIKKVNSAQTLKGGVGTCMARVTQTFTALMIRDTASTFLTKDFMSMTSDCFSEAQKIFNSQLSNTSKDIKLSLNKISSDVHWFHDKVSGLNQMALDNQIELTPESNIVEKYQDLNVQSRSVTETISSLSNSFYINRKYAVAVGALGAMLLISFVVVTVRHRNKELELFSSYDVEAQSILDGSSSIAEAKQKTNRLLENIFVTLNTPNCHRLVQAQEVVGVQSHNLSTITPQMNVEQIVKSSDVKVKNANLSSILGKLLMQSSFSKNTQVHQEIHANIHVVSDSDEISQYIKTLFSFIDEKVISHGVENLSVTSKPLGSIAYVKVSLEDLLFTSEELEILTDKSTAQSSNMNLTLLKEIGSELGVNLTFKNLIGTGTRRSQAQIEFTMTRSEQDSSSPVLKKLIKGSKREILESMKNNA